MIYIDRHVQVIIKIGLVIFRLFLLTPNYEGEGHSLILNNSMALDKVLEEFLSEINIHTVNTFENIKEDINEYIIDDLVLYIFAFNV
ncbi:MAG: hypothetical protein ACR2F1_15300 [Nitrososphaeraceae archaeon]